MSSKLEICVYQIRPHMWGSTFGQHRIHYISANAFIHTHTHTYGRLENREGRQCLSVTLFKFSYNREM